jgi:hypothetical protein
VSVSKRKALFASFAASRAIEKGGAKVADETEHLIEALSDATRCPAVEL